MALSPVFGLRVIVCNQFDLPSPGMEKDMGLISKPLATGACLGMLFAAAVLGAPVQAGVQQLRLLKGCRLHSSKVPLMCDQECTIARLYIYAGSVDWRAIAAQAAGETTRPQGLSKRWATVLIHKPEVNAV